MFKEEKVLETVATYHTEYSNARFGPKQLVMIAEIIKALQITSDLKKHQSNCNQQETFFPPFSCENYNDEDRYSEAKALIQKMFAMMSTAACSHHQQISCT